MNWRLQQTLLYKLEVLWVWPLTVASMLITFFVLISCFSDLARGLHHIEDKFVPFNESNFFVKLICFFFCSKILVFSKSTIVWKDNSSHTIFILRQVKGVVCDNHATSFLACKKLKEEYLDEVKSLNIIYQRQRVYLFHDTVHLVKNIRNNLLGNKRVLFPEFDFFFGFEQDVIMPGGELSWRLLHDVHYTMVEAVPAWEKRTDSMFRYENKY